MPRPRTRSSSSSRSLPWLAATIALAGTAALAAAAGGAPGLVTHPPIPVAADLASLSPASSSPLAARFHAALAALDDTASDLTDAALPPSLARRTAGFPGTALARDPDRAANLQAALDCYAANGRWVHDPSGDLLTHDHRGLLVHKQDPRYAACDKRFYKAHPLNDDDDDGDDGDEWHVRPSLQWRWVPSPECDALAPALLPAPAPSLSRVDFCRLVAHKALLLVGDATHYQLHDLVLALATTQPQSCYGDLYCKEHALCGDILRAQDAAAVERADTDERVYHRVPNPPGLLAAAAASSSSSSSHPPPPSPHSLYPSPTYGTLLRYRRTDGLRASSAFHAPTFAHPSTGVREVNQPWLADARRSDVVVLSKPPLPLPLRSVNASFWAALDAVSDDPAAARGELLVELAAEWTARVWLPELVDSLRAIRAPPSPADVLVVYRSGWLEHADCASLSSSASSSGAEGDGPAPRAATPSLDALVGGGEADVPLALAWHNAQLVLQNRAARRAVLPRFGAVFLDVETGMSVWRAGMVGSASAPAVSPGSAARGEEQVVLSGLAQGLRSPTSGDCTRYCLPSPGLGLETFFLEALQRVFHAAWVGEEGWDGERADEWVGEAFVNLREREARRARGEGEAEERV
ncbi:uncharacterized protein JCM10292_000876 [Rhodotorula paludigena]|uniref:uncharacterized protein n=1 Tax=Rhodotorula paludigena TaxID=86838 RepID=UPI00317FF506